MTAHTVLVAAWPAMAHLNVRSKGVAVSYRANVGSDFLSGRQTLLVAVRTDLRLLDTSAG